MRGFKLNENEGTRGIWMWNELIPVIDEEGRATETDILILDTEGLHSPNRSFDIDVKIFSLSLLLSSNFVYNQIGSISDDSFEELSMIQMLPSELKFKHPNEINAEFRNFFPEFHWVLRDFNFDFKNLT